MNEHKYMQNTITDEYHWKHDNTHLHRVAEVAVMVLMFSTILLGAIILS